MVQRRAINNVDIFNSFAKIEIIKKYLQVEKFTETKKLK